MKTNLSRVLFAVILLGPTVALAHPGDHTSLTVTQIAHHIATSPDHLLEVGFLALVVFGQRLRIHRRSAR